MNSTPPTASSPLTTSATEVYGRTAMALHWVVFGLIAATFALGWVMTEMAVSPQKLRLYNWHKWAGITVLGLAALRTLWRLTHPAPADLPMPAWQAKAAHALHRLLYVLMFAIPLSGWAYSNAVGYPIVYLGKFRLPDLVEKNRELGKTLVEVHELLGWALVALVTLHVLAALKHHFIDKDATLRRMTSWRAS